MTPFIVVAKNKRSNSGKLAEVCAFRVRYYFFVVPLRGCGMSLV